MRHETEYSPAKTEKYPRIVLNFQNRVCCEKHLKDNEHNSLHLVPKHARLRSWKTGRFSEQIMSADKYCAKWRLLFICVIQLTSFDKICHFGPKFLDHAKIIMSGGRFECLSSQSLSDWRNLMMCVWVSTSCNKEVKEGLVRILRM